MKRWVVRVPSVTIGMVVSAVDAVNQSQSSVSLYQF